MWPTVTPSDVADMWRPLTADEESVAGNRITVVQAELRRELRMRGVVPPAVGDPGYPVQEDVDDWAVLYVAAVASAVKRGLQNPEGFLEESEQIDDYQWTGKRDSATSTGEGYLSEDDVLRLLPPVYRPRGSFSIRNT